MPNDCQNTLKISGSALLIHEFFLKHFTGDSRDFDFNTIIPQPTLIEDCPEEYRQPITPGTEHDERPWFNWYRWRCDHWGTKWDAYDVTANDPYYDQDYEPGDDMVTEVDFSTAWSPPSHELMKELSRQNPLLTFNLLYYECGCAFAGSCEYRNEELLNEEYVGYEKDKEQYFDFLIEHNIEDRDMLAEWYPDEDYFKNNSSEETEDEPEEDIVIPVTKEEVQDFINMLVNCNSNDK